MYRLIIIVALMGCQYNPFWRDHKPTQTVNIEVDNFDIVQNKWELYWDLTQKKGSNFGFRMDTCDSLEFTGLYCAIGGDVDIFEAEKEPGKWCRTWDCRCFNNNENNGADSSISRDMFRGLLLCLWAQKDLEAFKRVIHYGETHNWIMGEYANEQVKLGKTLMSLSMQADFYEGAYQLGGIDHAKRAGMDVYTPQLGFKRFLQALAILYRGLAKGAINDIELNTMKENVKAEYSNAVYHGITHLFTDGNQNIALALLADNDRYPSDRLPTSEEYCTDFLYQRDEIIEEDLIADAEGCVEYNDSVTKELVKECKLAVNSIQPRYVYNDDWLPCPERNEEHEAIDFLFAGAIILNKFKANTSVRKLAIKERGVHLYKQTIQGKSSPK